MPPAAGGPSAAAERFRRVRLYVLITAEACHLPWLDAAEEALAGGAGALQLREKHLPGRELLLRARALAALCRRYNALLIINDRPDIAVAAEADGVHLGQEDLPVEAARRVVGPRMIIGCSSHTPEQAAAALGQPIDYLAVGPMFESATKPQPRIAGPALLQCVRPLTSLPIVAIGGIAPANVAQLPEADAAAVCQAVAATPEPAAAAAALLAEFTRARGAGSAKGGR